MQSRATLFDRRGGIASGASDEHLTQPASALPWPHCRAAPNVWDQRQLVPTKDLAAMLALRASIHRSSMNATNILGCDAVELLLACRLQIAWPNY